VTNTLHHAASSLDAVLQARHARLLTAESVLAQVLVRLAQVDAEIAGLDGDLGEIARMHAAWEQEWQRWMREDGKPTHGKAHVDQHLHLAAWRTELTEQRDEQRQRRAAIQAEADAARTRIARMHARIELLQQALQRAAAAHHGLRHARQETDAAEALAARAWSLGDRAASRRMSQKGSP
jgi:chromosome segregation ATPase